MSTRTKRVQSPRSIDFLFLLSSIRLSQRFKDVLPKPWLFFCTRYILTELCQLPYINFEAFWGRGKWIVGYKLREGVGNINQLGEVGTRLHRFTDSSRLREGLVLRRGSKLGVLYLIFTFSFVSVFIWFCLLHRNRTVCSVLVSPHKVWLPISVLAVVKHMKIAHSSRLLQPFFLIYTFLVSANCKSNCEDK